MNTVRKPTLTVAVLALAVAGARAADWKVYTFKEANCKVAFPGEPKAAGEGFVSGRNSVPAAV